MQSIIRCAVILSILSILSLSVAIDRVNGYTAVARDDDNFAQSMGVITEMMDKADLLVVITPSRENGSIVSTVDSVYKGDIQPGEKIRISLQGYIADLKGIALINALHSNKPLLCFLSRDDDEHYRFTFYSLTSKAVRVRYLNWAWLRVADKRPDVNHQGIRAVQAELMGGLQSTDSIVADDCATWMMAINRPYLEKLVNSDTYFPEPSNVILFYRALFAVRKGGKTDIEHAVSIIDNIRKYLIDNLALTQSNPANTAPALQEYLLKNKWLDILSMQFMYISTTDRETIQILNHLIVEDVNLRHNIVHSTPNWADYSSIPYLMKILPELEDTYQYIFLRVLSRLTGRDIPPNTNAFQKQRAAVIADWVDWWKREGEPAFTREY